VSASRRSQFPPRDRLLRDIFLILAVAFVLLRLLQVEPWDDSIDAFAYWTTRDGTLYEAATTGTIGSYLYSPAFAQLLAPAVILPWHVFAALWTALNLAAYGWLLGRLALPLLIFLPFPFEIVSGNVHLLLAAMVVIGLRRHGAWAWLFAAITKVTPLVGLLWFGVRRDWRSVGIAAAATGLVVGISFLLSPGQWGQWLGILTRDIGAPLETPGWYLPVPLLPRALAAAVLVGWGARSDRRWTVPVAIVLAMPVVWLNSLAVLAAVVPLTERGRAWSAWRGWPAAARLAPGGLVPGRPEPAVGAPG
jgi:glycosyl transferase family 87